MFSVLAHKPVLLNELANPGRPSLAYVKNLSQIHGMLCDCRYGGKLSKTTRVGASEVPRLKIDDSTTDNQFSQRFAEIMDGFSDRIEIVCVDQERSLKHIKATLTDGDEKASSIRGTQLNLLDQSILQGQITKLIVRRLDT